MDTPQPSIQTEPQKQDRLWTADFIKIGLLAFIFSLAYQMFYTAFPLYMGSLGGNSTLIGLATGGFTIAAFAARPIAGHLLDTKGRKVVLMVGLVMSILLAAGLAFIPSIAAILLLRILQGPGIATVSTSNGTIVSDILPRKRLAEGLGYYGVFFTIATAFGPAIALAVIKGENYSPVLLMNVGILAVAFLLALTINYEKKRAKQALIQTNTEAAEQSSPHAVAPAEAGALSNVAHPPSYKGIWKFVERTSLTPALISAVLSLSSAAAMTFLVPFAISRGFESIAAFFTVQAIAALVVRLVGGTLSTRYGTLPVLVPGLVLVGVSFFLIAPMNSVPLLLTAAAIHGAGYGLCYPVLNALSIMSAPPSRRGIANSTYACSFDIGIGIGSTIWGIVADAAGYPPAFIAAGILAFFCLGLSIAVFRKKRAA